MAGGYVHITAAAKAMDRLGEVRGLSPTDKMAVSSFMPLVEVGSVSPDMPYFGMQTPWADRMHYQTTGDMLRHGARYLRQLENGSARHKSLSWLLGYAAHVATDLTIHPVVQERVGPYAENKMQHRTCEMHQDAYIWPRRNLGDLGLADYFKVSIGHCSTPDGNMDANIAALWGHMLKSTYQAEFAEDRPKLDRWLSGYRRLVTAITDIGHLVPISRHIIANAGITYPASNDVDMSYIENLATPEGPKHYDDVFDRAISSILSTWSKLGLALNAASEQQAEQALADLPNGNLDTGADLNTGDIIFWTET